MFNAGSIVGSLGLDLDPYQRSILKAQGLSATFGTTLSTMLAAPLLGVANLAARAGQELVNMATAGIAAFQQNVKDVAAFVDELDDLSAKAAVSVEFLSTFGRIAEDSGSSTQAFADMLAILNRNLTEMYAAAASGKDETGISRFLDKEGKLVSTEEAVLRIADAVKEMSAQEASGFLNDLMSRGATDLIPMLKGGSDELQRMARIIREVGGEVDQELANAGGKFSMLGTVFGAAWQGIKNELARPVLQAAAANFAMFTESIKVGANAVRTFIHAAWSGILQALGVAPSDTMLQYLKQIETWVNDNRETITGLFRDVAETVSGWLSSLKDVNVVLDSVLAAIDKGRKFDPLRWIREQVDPRKMFRSTANDTVSDLKPQDAITAVIHNRLSPAQVGGVMIGPIEGPRVNPFTMDKGNRFAGELMEMFQAADFTRLARDSQDATRGLQSLARQAMAATDAMGGLRGATRSEASGDERGQDAGNKIDVHVTVPPFDPNEAASVYAAKVLPIFRAEIDRRTRTMTALTQSHRVLGGL